MCGYNFFMNKLRLALFFGGRSTEHEVSVISALQAYKNLNQDKYEITAVYVSKDGDFYTNPKFLDLKNFKEIDTLLLSSARVTFGRKGPQGGIIKDGLLSNKFSPVDVALPIFHGAFGEDGCIQGLFEIYQIPYVGFNVTGSAVGMDKAVAKALFLSMGLPVGRYTEIKRIDWIKNPKKCLQEAKSKLKFPLFIKPATTGSTIGVNKAVDIDMLQFGIEVATCYSEKILIEEAFQNVIEVNCSALGYEEVKASVCEMPVASGDILSYDDKYIKGNAKGSKSAGMASLSRVIPAPISEKLTKQIQETTIRVFKAIDGCGVARIDYFVDKKREKFWINEINTIPGSLSFYLWEKSGIKYSELLDIVIKAAIKRAENQKKTQYTFNSPLLSQMAQVGGIKR